MALTWSSGELITAAKLNRPVPLQAFKTANQAVTNSIVLVNDTALFLDLPANRQYKCRLELAANGNVAGELRIAWTVTGTLTTVVNRRVVGPALAMTTTADTTVRLEAGYALTSAVQYGMAAGNAFIIEEFQVDTGASGGRLQMQWAQGVANAAATNVAAGLLTALAVA